MIKFLLFLSCFGLCWGWLPFLNPSEDNDCDMTFMYYQPNYMDVGFKYGNYGYNLWLYGEGWYAMNYMNQKKLGGIPVVFVPGNAGSGKQARSIGSLLHNKTLLRNTPFHFDTFTFDFNEEFSGLDSSALLREADYVEKGIQYIWTLYKQPPPGIIFIGHSMGGMVIKSVIGNLWFDLNRVAFVLTLSTPHYKSPLPMDKFMLNFWHDVDEAWNSTRITNSHVRLVSISSGIKDELIYEPLTKIERSNFYHFSSTSIDRVWVEADHKAVVWCNQLVRQNSRFIFEYAEDPQKFIANIDAVIGKHFDGPQRVLKPVKTSNVEAANVVAVTKEADNVVVALGKVSDSDIITNDNCRGVTRYLDSSHYFNVIENSECDGVQFLADKKGSYSWAPSISQLIVQSVHLPFYGAFFDFQFTVASGLKKLRMSFSDTYKQAVYIVNVDRKCPKIDKHMYQVYFQTENGDRRFLKKSSSSGFFRIYNPNQDGGYLFFVDADECEYSVQITLDCFYTLKSVVMDYTTMILLFVIVLPFFPAFITGTSLLVRTVFYSLILSGLFYICVHVFVTEPIEVLIAVSLVISPVIYVLSAAVYPIQTFVQTRMKPLVDRILFSNNMVIEVVKLVLTIVLLRCFPFTCTTLFFMFVQAPHENAFTRYCQLIGVFVMAVPGTLSLVNLVKYRSHFMPSYQFFVAAIILWPIECRYPQARTLKTTLLLCLHSILQHNDIPCLDHLAIVAGIFNLLMKTCLAYR